jgi:hypothetical protein
VEPWHPRCLTVWVQSSSISCGSPRRASFISFDVQLCGKCHRCRELWPLPEPTTGTAFSSRCWAPRPAPHGAPSRWAGGTLSQRRNNKGPVDHQRGNSGGWNLFITVATALDASTPLTNPYLATPCPNDVAGFPCDEELQRLRRSWWESTDEAERALLADRIQERAYQVVPYINGGQWKQFTAVRTNVSGLGETTVPVFWEVAKEG